MGCPPTAYYTNPNEAMNSALKNKTNYTKQQLSTFVSTMKSFVLEQQAEVEKSIIGVGKYRIRECYKSLEVLDGTWWRPMNEQQRKARIKKFNNQVAIATEDDDGECPLTNSNVQHHHQLSVAEEVAVVKLNLSVEIVTGIWQKAALLVADETSICTVPGGSKEDWHVLSKSGLQPHLVRGNDGYIYSHAVATAEVNGNLTKFVEWYTKTHSCKSLNLFQASKHGMPAGAGYKERVKKPTKKRKKGPDTKTVPFSKRVDIVSPRQPSVVTPDSISAQSPSPEIAPYSGSSPHLQPYNFQSPQSYYNSYTMMNLGPSTSDFTSPYSWSNTSSCNPVFPSPSNFPPVFPSPPSQFHLIILHGNISVCYGCRAKFPRKISGEYEDRPFNLAIQHEEERQFTNPKTSLQQSKRSNAYYHVFLTCISTKWPTFNPFDLKVSADVKQKLTEEHVTLVFRNLGVNPMDI
jgi:hypothetical protein